MAITVTPQTFSYVSFDADLIRRIADEIAGSIGLHDTPITIEVDETSPMARIAISIHAGEDGDSAAPDGIYIHAASGAFEDTRRPRQQSETATATSLGRVLLRASDRLTGGFGEAPPDDQLSLPQISAWETYSIGRLERLGIPVNRQRWLYNFRNRHGFTDAGDAAFEQLWQSDALTWGSLCAISDSARAVLEAS